MPKFPPLQGPSSEWTALVAVTVIGLLLLCLNDKVWQRVLGLLEALAKLAPWSRPSE